MEKRMNLFASIAIKILISAFLFCVAYVMSITIPGISPMASTWAYTFAGICSYLMFGFLLDRTGPNGFNRLLNFTAVIIAILLIISIISLFGVFTGPAGIFCGWPSFFSAIILFIAFGIGCSHLYCDYVEGQYDEWCEY